MKKILVTAAGLSTSKRGATRSTYALINRLSKDFNLVLITPDKKDSIKKLSEYTLITKKTPLYINLLKSFLKIDCEGIWWRKILKKFLKNNKFDFLMSHGIIIPAIINLPIKKAIFIREVGFFCPGVDSINPLKCKKGFFTYLPWIFKLQYPLLLYYRKKSLESIKKANMLIANTNSLIKFTKNYTGRKPILVNSEIKENEYLITKKDPKYILFVNPTHAKGVDLMYQIAKRLPTVKFMVAGKSDIIGNNAYRLLIKLKNVSHIGEVSDMKEIYRKARLLVNPSRCYEGFARTPAEAMMNGIPSVVSNLGGLPEVVGNSGEVVKNIEDVNEWIKKIKKYEDKIYYKNKQRICKKRFNQFKIMNNNQYKVLKEYFKHLKQTP